MKKYYLASPEERSIADLRLYEETIVQAVKSVIPNAKVKVCEKYYTVDHITRGQAVAIGRILARTELWEYHMDAPKLFIGEKMEEKNGTKRRKKT